MADIIGRVLAGRYRVETFLGKGGMAEVYKVWDQTRSVYLAMKILQADLAEDKIFLRRFKREAQTLAKLQHPNIVRFYGLEQDHDLVFILMDYIEGTTLRKDIFQAKGPFTPEQILEIIQPVCAALHYAHQSGFVHCDVKPANIMLGTNGMVLVSDFGIARMTESATATMVGAGTPAYMAPEQARGETPTAQTDIYALGVILFEMITGGERPFTGEYARTTGSTSEKVRWEQMNLTPPSPRGINPSVSLQLEKIVMICLDKNPAKRYQTSLDLLNELKQCLSAAKSSTKSREQADLKGKMPFEVQSVKQMPVVADPVQPKITPVKVEEKRIAKPETKRTHFIGAAFGWFALVVFLCIVGVGIASTQLMSGGSSSIKTPAATATALVIATQTTQLTETVFPTEIVSQQPIFTPTPSCYPWNEITNAMLGNDVCVYGQMYSQRLMTYGGSRIVFDANQSFFLVSSDFWFPDLKKGTCVKGLGKVELSTEKILYVNVKGTLYLC